MEDAIPKGARLASRIILIGPNDSVLYLRGREPKTKKVFWIMPGGGLEDEESFEDAAKRELQEEAGCSFSLGPYVWFRKHKYLWNGKPAFQYERYFVAQTNELSPKPKKQDDYISEYRWWTVKELLSTKEYFVPRAVAKLLPNIIQRNYPDVAIDCGV